MVIYGSEQTYKAPPFCRKKSRKPETGKRPGKIQGMITATHKTGDRQSAVIGGYSGMEDCGLRKPDVESRGQPTRKITTETETFCRSYGLTQDMRNGTDVPGAARTGKCGQNGRSSQMHSMIKEECKFCSEPSKKAMKLV